MGLAIFLFLATLLSISCHAELDPIIQLRPPVSASGDFCLSWRLAVEAHNIRDWSSVPRSCVNYIEAYMFSGQYYRDCDTMAVAAAEYAKTVPISGNHTDVWVFDVDETMLSNVILFASPDIQFGITNLTLFNELFYEWVKEGSAPPIPGILRLYNTVLSLGFKTVILTGATESLREYRIANLKSAGYDGWDILFLRGENDLNKTQEGYKSEKRSELVKKGYRIVGNVGDQWSDLVGEHVGNRTFKVPNPMYYAP